MGNKNNLPETIQSRRHQTTSLKCWKKINISLEFDTQQKQLSKTKMKQILFRYSKAKKKITTSRPTLQEIVKEIPQAEAKRNKIKIWICTKEERALQMVTT